MPTESISGCPCCGGGSTNSCCSPVVMPDILYLTISGATGGLAGLNGNVYTLTWNAGLGAWAYSDGSWTVMEWRCSGTGSGAFTLNLAGCVFLLTGTSSPVTCSPFEAHITSLAVTGTCGTGDVTWNITE